MWLEHRPIWGTFLPILGEPGAAAYWGRGGVPLLGPGDCNRKHSKKYEMKFVNPPVKYQFANVQITVTCLPTSMNFYRSTIVVWKHFFYHLCSEGRCEFTQALPCLAVKQKLTDFGMTYKSQMCQFQNFKTWLISYSTLPKWNELREHFWACLPVY